MMTGDRVDPAAIPSDAIKVAIARYQDHHPGAVCVDCLTLIYQAGALDAAGALAAAGAPEEGQRHG